MENISNTFKNESLQMNRVSLKAGVYTAAGLVCYFVIMRLFNLHHYLELHYLNVIVLFLGLRYALQHIKQITGEIRYFEGLKSGLIVTLISVFLFNIFMLIYETLIDPPFLLFLKEKITLGPLFSVQETAVEIAGILVAEGLSSGFVLTFILMQYYKSESSETM
jgi:hypothetical protein